MDSKHRGHGVLLSELIIVTEQSNRCTHTGTRTHSHIRTSTYTSIHQCPLYTHNSTYGWDKTLIGRSESISSELCANLLIPLVLSNNIDSRYTLNCRSTVLIHIDSSTFVVSFFLSQISLFGIFNAIPLIVGVT